MVATTANKRRYSDNSNGGNYNGNYNNNNNSNNNGYNSNSNYRSNNYRGRAPENIENMPCHIHPGTRHKLVECSTFQRQFMKRENRNQNNSEQKQEESKKEEKKAEGDYQEPQRQLAVIFSGVPNT